MRLRNPVLVGFGIRDKVSFDLACSHSSGAVIGTAFIRALEGGDNIGVATTKFLSTILK
jgi:tryptophan synthase alpha chain